MNRLKKQITKTYLPCSRRPHALHQLGANKSESIWQSVVTAKVIHKPSLPLFKLVGSHKMDIFKIRIN